MSAIVLLPKESSLARSSVAALTSFYPLTLGVGDYDDPGTQIAAIRLYIPRLGKKDQRQYQIVLCKLVAMYPDAASAYFVESPSSPAFRKVMQLPQIQKLYNVYRRKMDQMGSGFWVDRRFETIINAISRVEDGSVHAAMLHRETFKQLIATYNAQSEAFVAEDTPKVTADADDVRSLLSKDAFASSAQARKYESLDRRGQCYCCGAPKPRRVVCKVCGYLPSTGVSK